MRTASHGPVQSMLLWLAALALLACVNSAHAQITCTASSGGFSTAYPMSGGALNITAASVSVTCSRNFGGPNVATRTATYQLAATSSPQTLGGQRRARIPATANYLNYNLNLDSGCTTTLWQGTTYTPSYTTTGLAKGGSDTHLFFYYGCVPAGLTVPAGGTYTDTFNINFVNRSVSGGPSTFTGAAGVLVNITAPATCSFSTPPGNLVFNYTAFGAAAAASTTFAATCSNLLPYNLSLDAGGAGYTGSFTSPTGTYTNTATNLTYTLTLPPNPFTGNGVAQTYTITGAMAAGQGGTCAGATCTVTDIHMLTVTY